MFNMIPGRAFTALLATLMALLPTLPARAQAPASTDAASKNKAAEILDAIVETTGGAKAREPFKASVSRATLNIVGMGMSGKVTIHAAAPGYSLSVAELPGMGEMIEGCDGAIAWGTSALTGPRLKDGTELAQALRASTFQAELHWRDLYRDWAYLGEEEVDGRKCHKLLLTPHEGDPETSYVEVETGLPYKTVGKAISPMGEVEVETILADYKKVEGILTPHKLTQKMMMQEIAITIYKLEYLKEADLSVFEPPADIKELLEMETADGGSK